MFRRTQKEDGPAPDDSARLDRLYWMVKAKVQDRHRGSNRWQGLRIGLGLAAILLSGVGGASIYSDWAGSDPMGKLVLGSLTLLGGLCAAFVAFLKPDERYFANRSQLIKWEALLLDVDRARAKLNGMEPDQADKFIKDLGTTYTVFDEADLAVRQGKTLEADETQAAQRESEVVVPAADRANLTSVPPASPTTEPDSRAEVSNRGSTAASVGLNETGEAQ